MAWNHNRSALDPNGSENQFDGTGAVAGPQSVLCSTILRPFTLELLNISPHTDKSCPKDFFKAGHDRSDFFLRISEIEPCYSHHMFYPGLTGHAAVLSKYQSIVFWRPSSIRTFG